MTHTLHRQGPRESVEGDFVVLAMAAREHNVKKAAPKLRRIAEILSRYNPVNMGNMSVEKPTCMARGISVDEILENISDKSIVHAVYADKDDVEAVLKELAKEDIGISIVVSGIFDNIFKVSKDVGLKGPFTVNLSLGIFGKKEILPPPEILEITTMCGHGLISKDLAKDLLEKVKKGSLSPEKAAGELAEQCVCGVFNTTRAQEIIERIINELEVIEKD